MTTGEFAGFDFTWLAAWPILINVLTHFSLLLELLYPVLIWVKILATAHAGRRIAASSRNRRDESRA